MKTGTIIYARLNMGNEFLPSIISGVANNENFVKYININGNLECTRRHGLLMFKIPFYKRLLMPLTCLRLKMMLHHELRKHNKY